MICLTSICLSVAYIGPKSKTERPRKTKIGTEVARITRDSDNTFRVKRSRSPGRFGWLCWQAKHGNTVMVIGDIMYIVSPLAGLGGGISWRPPAYNLFFIRVQHLQWLYSQWPFTNVGRGSWLYCINIIPWSRIVQWRWTMMQEKCPEPEKYFSECGTPKFVGLCLFKGQDRFCTEKISVSKYWNFKEMYGRFPIAIRYWQCGFSGS